MNGIGQVVKEQSLGADGVYDIVEAKYTNLGQPWKQSRPYRSGDTVRWSETFYDLQGRTIKIKEPDDSETTAFYNEPTSTKPSSAASAVGQTVRVVDAWGRERWGRYNAKGKLAEVVEPNPTGNGTVAATGNLATSYQYDTLNRLTETTQGSQIRKFKYDSLGRLTRQKLAEQSAALNDSGQYVGATGTWSEAFWYDTRSNLTMKTDARGVKTHYSYQTGGADDPLNRLQSRYYDLSGPLDTSATIHNAPSVFYEYMTTGDKTRVNKIITQAILTENFTYDGESRVIHYTQTVASRESYPMTTSYAYDTLNRVKEVTYPAQYGLAGNPRKVVEHSFDVASRLSTLKVGGQQQAGDIIYNAADQTTSIKIGTSGTNQVTELYSYDSLTGLLTNQKAQRGGLNLLDLSYEYNRNNSVGTGSGKTGHLTKIVDNLNPHKNREYEFDALGRLTKAKGGTNERWTQTYSYDRYGNRTNVTATGTAADNSPIPLDGTPNLTYEATDNRINTSGYLYDKAGNQIKAKAPDGSWLRFEYDAANRIQVVKRDSDGATLQAFQYGSTNARLMDMDYTYGYLKIFAAVGGTTLTEYTEFYGNTPSWTKSYNYLGDSVLSTITPNGQGGENVEFNHPDRLGTRVITNQSAGTSYEQTTLPFGTALNAESTVTTNSRRFTSYERSSPTGLDYAINRKYDSKQGRFTQVDPIGMSAVSLASPQTLNLYTYCGNDPINYTDPSGLFFGGFFKWIVKILKIVAAVILAVVAVLAFASGDVWSGIQLAMQSAQLWADISGNKTFQRIVAIASIAISIYRIRVQPPKTTASTFPFLGGGGVGDGIDPNYLFIFAGVGAIANSFAQTKDKKRPKRTSPMQIRIAFFKLYGKKFNQCLKKVFGNDYKKIGNQTLANSPIIDTTLSKAQTGANSGVAGATGSSDPFYGKHGKVFIDSATYNSKDWNARKAIFGTYAHETANILDIRLNPNEPQATYGRVYGDPNDGFDTDTGARVERCLFGGLQYPNQVVK